MSRRSRFRWMRFFQAVNILSTFFSTSFIHSAKPRLSTVFFFTSLLFGGFFSLPYPNFSVTPPPPRRTLTQKRSTGQTTPKPPFPPRPSPKGVVSLNLSCSQERSFYVYRTRQRLAPRNSGALRLFFFFLLDLEPQRRDEEKSLRDNGLRRPAMPPKGVPHARRPFSFLSESFPEVWSYIFRVFLLHQLDPPAARAPNPIQRSPAHELHV